ncbi:MAG: N-acyl homoserine lactonase family protein [Roseiarcus sp.]|jgi:glyoxylase-like metal-dependent hydrolase (beta-lactamase superfamily II)
MRIHALRTGRVQVKSSQLVARGHGLARRLAPLFDEAWSDWLPTYAFAVEHRDGVVLVDTGASAALKRLPRWHPYFRLAVRFDIEPEEEAGPRLRALGIGPSDVKLVVVTHLHIDHDAGLAAFPRSRTLVSPGEIRSASGLAGQIRGYLPQRWPSSFDPEPLVFAAERYGPFARSRRLTADGAVIAVPTPGHTPDHVSIVVEDGDCTVVMAGDASYSEASLIEGRLDGISPNEASALATLSRLRELAAARPTVFLPTHDPQSADRLARRQTVAFAAADGAPAKRLASQGAPC